MPYVNIRLHIQTLYRVGFAFGEFQKFLFSTIVGTLGTLSTMPQRSPCHVSSAFGRSLFDFVCPAQLLLVCLDKY